MCPRTRLPAGLRKKEIRDSAKKIFLKKGFISTPMEDVIAETGMSKGGVYRHYKSTYEMLYDLMLDGNDIRYERIDEFLISHPNSSMKDLAMEVTVMKMIDQAEYKSLYAMFLIEAEKNPKFKELKDELTEQSKKEFLNFIKERNLGELKCLMNEEWIALTNSIIVATELLDVRDVFLKHKDLFKSIVCQYIDNQKNENKGETES